MKKTLAIIMIAITAMTCSLAFVGCNKDSVDAGKTYSETFVGATSNETYESASAAINGFLEDEVSGGAFTAVYVDYKKTDDLSKSQIDELAIDEEFKDGIISVEKGEVEYAEQFEEESLTTNLASNTKKRAIYIIMYAEMFRFFIPQNSQGESLSASYFGSTFDVTKYFNCAMEAELRNYTEEGMKIDQKSYCKITEHALYERDEYTVNAEGTIVQAPGFEFYVVYSQGYSYLVQKGEDEFENDWEVDRKLQCTIQQYFIEWFKQHFGDLDHTYFEKTATGYKMRADLYNKYIKEVAGKDVKDFDLEYTINISEGRMSDVTTKIAFQGFESSMKIVFSDFGSTSFEVPKEVMKAVETK